jgi:hypothetical protein
MTKIRCYAAAVLVVVIAFSVAASAQNAPAATGKVVGPDSKPLAGVPIQVVGPEGATTAFTDASGTWSLYNLVPGTYQVRPAVGKTEINQPTIGFTVSPKGLFGSNQGNTIYTTEMKLDWNAIPGRN